MGYQLLTMGGRFEHKVPVAGRPGHDSEIARRAREEMRAAVGRVRAEAAAALLDVDEAPSALAEGAPSRVARSGVSRSGAHHDGDDHVGELDAPTRPARERRH